jgi:hypothetical protein
MQSLDGKYWVEWPRKGSSTSMFEAAITNIGGMLFSDEFPGEYPGIIREEAYALVNGFTLSPDRQKIRDRLRELTGWKPYNA